MGQWLPATTFEFFVLCCHFDNLFWNTGHYEGIQLWEFCPLAIKEPKLTHFFFLAVAFGFVLNAACMNTVPTSENIKMFVLIVTESAASSLDLAHPLSSFFPEEDYYCSCCSMPSCVVLVAWRVIATGGLLLSSYHHFES